MSISTILEICATLSSLIYIILLIKENRLCWPFGIVGSALSIYLMLSVKLYSEAILYSYYVVVGFWGWMRWHQLESLRNNKQDNPIIHWTIGKHLKAIFVCSLMAIGLGMFFQTTTDAERPIIDAFTTIFSFLATYMEVTKVLATWVYWIVLNLAAIWLYKDRELDIYAALTGVYAILSIWGYIRWNKAYQLQQATV
ncbi:nicotinamide riboside transporter PnuC [Thalassotalea crassostreae]|uniref:nicotinamide riboside transporter PnuC n=1 Tax=Thalassotalea crassostreae TaxID=1763536 RepID=UPI00083818D9|nr:nicotinamide riboside transporter PnuC [Thalassotalea crassostreae]